jgi:enoyl-CoA hydratase/isomerase-like protein
MPVTYRKRGPIGIVTLSRPKACNAWGADFNEGIARHFAAMEDEDAIRCAVLTGNEAGGAFSAGANLKDPKTHTLASAAEFIIPNLSDASLVDLYRFAALEQTEDKTEGHAAWREKRRATFRGR